MFGFSTNALATNDIETLRKRIGELEQAAAMMAQYANQAGSTSGADSATDTTATAGAHTNDQDVVDVDYSEK